jgi:hypothetical protein
MVERKSKPRKKKDEDEEPTGWRKITSSPWFLLAMWVLIIAAVVALLFGLAEFLSGGG